MTSLLTRALIRYLLPLKNPPRSRTTVYMSSSSSLPSSSYSLPSSSSSSWSCPRCTFLNPSSQRVSCQMCLSPTAGGGGGGGSTFSVGASASPGRWPCTACTYLNPNGRAFCEVCGTRAAPFSRFLGDCIDPDELSAADSSIGSVFLPLQRCGSKRPAPAEAAADARPLEKLARSEKEHLVLSGMLRKTEKAKN